MLGFRVLGGGLESDNITANSGGGTSIFDEGSPYCRVSVSGLFHCNYVVYDIPRHQLAMAESLG